MAHLKICNYVTYKVIIFFFFFNKVIIFKLSTIFEGMMKKGKDFHSHISFSDTEI